MSTYYVLGLVLLVLGRSVCRARRISISVDRYVLGTRVLEGCEVGGVVLIDSFSGACSIE